MANDFEKRLSRLEDRFDEYMAMFHRWLDELRADHEQSKLKIELSERRIDQNEETQRIIIEMQRDQGKLLSRVVTTQDEQRTLLGKTVEALSEQGKVLAGVVETQGDILQLIDRMDKKIDITDKKLDNIDQKLDNLGKHGTNGKA